MENASPPALDRFLARFVAFGERPDVARYLDLFHPDATLRDAGMERPIGVAEIPEHIETVLKQVPDFRMTPERWRARDGTVFVEARNQATVGAGLARWRSIYCVDLEGDRVIRGRRYYDRRALIARLAPSLPALPAALPPSGPEPPPGERFASAEALVRAFGRAFEADEPDAFAALFREDGAFVGPDLPRPLARVELAGYHASLHALLSPIRMERVAFAGDDGLAFVEWEIHAALAGEPVLLRVADRFDWAGGQIVAGRAYFDTLELAARLAALASGTPA
ncbi:MAG TPA: nuclear transport factor 2 family protein [Myxococcota bacterium]|nr:nuclear transport factor 2 family protein [Myxococcota bacterium]